MSQLTKIILAAVLGLALVGVVLYQITRDPMGEKQRARTGTPAASNSVSSDAGEPITGELKESDVDVDALLAGIREVDFDYDRERMPRDPLTPLVGTVTRLRDEGDRPPDEVVPPAILSQVLSKTISGIVWDKRYPIAVVDNEVVHPGYEYADGTVVESIQMDRIVFRVGDSLIHVELEEL